MKEQGNNDHITEFMREILLTERLMICELTLNDADFIIELVNSPGWLRYIGDRNIHSVESAQQYLQNGPMKSYALNGFGLWMVMLKTDRIPIGMCGLLKRVELEHPDLGYALLPAFEGRGYITEAGRAVLDYVHHTYAISKILAITNPDNVGSIRVLEKLGFGFARYWTMPGENAPVKVFEL